MEQLDWPMRIVFVLTCTIPIVIAIIWAIVAIRSYWKRRREPKVPPRVSLVMPSVEETARSVSHFRRVIELAESLGFFSNHKDLHRIFAEVHRHVLDSQDDMGRPGPTGRIIDDYYALLQVQPDAASQIIRSAYRTLMSEMKLHPDLGGATAYAMKINEAYEVLSDPEKRRNYDSRRKCL